MTAFFQYDRPAEYDSVSSQVWVPVRDGELIWCTLYQPAVRGTTTLAPGPFPGLVNNFTPYTIAYPFDVFGGSYFAAHGYLDLECTPRGTGLSGGISPGWFAESEALDNYDLIEWLAAQPNSSGKIGQHGNSYGGMTALRVAALHPPSLVTIAPQQAYASLYLEFTYPGGIRSLGDPYWYGFATATGFVRPVASPQEANWAAHPLRDAYWEQIDIDTKWSQIDMPVLLFGGWPDVFQDGMVRNYLGLAGPDTYLIDGPWVHGNTFDATVTRGALLAWFDHWLTGAPDAPLPPSPVASYAMPDGPWQAIAAWPPPQSRVKTLAFTDAAGLAPAPTAAVPGSRSYVVNPGAGAADLESGDHLVFDGTPVATEVTIAGSGSVSLLASLSDPSGAATAAPDAVDTNFVVHLYDVEPSGGRRLVTRGYLKASHRSSHSALETIPLGVALTYDVPLWNVHYRLAAGHHLSLVLQSGEPECCLSAAPAPLQPILPLTVTVATGGDGSTLSLPMLGAGSDAVADPDEAGAPGRVDGDGAAGPAAPGAPGPPLPATGGSVPLAIASGLVLAALVLRRVGPGRR